MVGVIVGVWVIDDVGVFVGETDVLIVNVGVVVGVTLLVVVGVTVDVVVGVGVLVGVIEIVGVIDMVGVILGVILGVTGIIHGLGKIVPGGSAEDKDPSAKAIPSLLFVAISDCKHPPLNKKPFCLVTVKSKLNFDVAKSFHVKLDD